MGDIHDRGVGGEFVVVEEEAVELYIPKEEAKRKIVLTCEHASQRLPSPWTWPSEDLWILNTHWAVDLGARELTIELAKHLYCGAVLARFTRLLCDPNRIEAGENLFRNEAEGKPLVLNLNLSESEKEKRLDLYHRPYHAAVDRIVQETTDSGALVFSVHSFTPVYLGQKRTVEVGILFNEEDELAALLQQMLLSAGFEARLNEPYSGKSVSSMNDLSGMDNEVELPKKKKVEGSLIYSCERAAIENDRRCLEIECRQDLIVCVEWRERLAGVLVQFFREVGFA
jgi:predicted N-formylglutamate amidohydrolase